MTREEIKNTPELVDFMLDKCVLADSRTKVRKRLEEVCNLAIQTLEQGSKILNTLDFAIDASNGDTNYFVGFRNGLRYSKSLIDGEEPQFERCAEQEPCEDCISRQGAIDALDYNISITSDKGIDEYRPVIKEILGKIYDVQKAQIEALPSIQPKAKTGHWVHGEYCSECGCDVPAYISDWKWQKDMDAKYCPNCGVRMEE